MISRSDILVELGLSPLWLERSRLEQTPTVAKPAAHDLRSTPKDKPGDTASEEHASQTIRQSAAEKLPPQHARPPDVPVEQMDWPQLRQVVAGCSACALHAKRRQAVFGVGDERADWLIVGEGPGAEEDARGEPFVGQAGKLLDNMLSAIGLARGSNVYIANVVKCRPPGNRTPSPDEAEACAAFLDRQIDLIQPRLIIALGKVAARRMLGRDATLASLRKTIHDYRGIPLVVTYHPAYLLRNMPDKAKAWEDLCFAVDTMSGLTGAQDAGK